MMQNQLKVESIKNSNNEFYQSLDKYLWFQYRIIFKNEAELFYEEGMKKVIQLQMILYKKNLSNERVKPMQNIFFTIFDCPINKNNKNGRNYFQRKQKVRKHKRRLV